MPVSLILPATGTANIEAQTPLCLYMHAPIRVPYTHLSPGEHLLCALTPSTLAGHPDTLHAHTVSTWVLYTYLPWTTLHPGGWSILENLIWVRVDISNAYLGGGAEAKVWEKSRAASCPQT